QEIYKDRQKFSDQVFRVASSDLVNMGISVVSYTLKDVHDEQVTHLGYTWGRLGCTRDTPGMYARNTWGTPGHIWDVYEIRLGYIWGHTCRHLGCIWGTLGVHLGDPPRITCVTCTPPCPRLWQAARSQQAIAAQRGEVALVERAQRAQLQEQEVGRRQRELEATVRKPAEAERFRLERLAEAQR
ncbi:FLOT1 protein, partial [Menura novaehollandiae]|nr:FLOT1 protein [Menura novaehollandiae]